MPEASSEKIAGINKKWWYVIGAVAGIIVYVVYRNYEANKTAANAAATETAAATPVASGGTAGNASTNFGSTSTSTIATLSDWLNAAQQFAVSSLGSDPALVQNALQAYSNGNCLTNIEYNIVDKALGNLGMPPDAPYQGVILCPNQPSSSPIPIKTTVPSTPSVHTTSESATQFTLINRLASLVGNLSTTTKKGSTSEQISGWQAIAQKLFPNNSVAQQLYIQEQNIGNIDKQAAAAQGISITQITTLAKQLAAQDGHSYASLNIQEQQTYNDIANVTLMNQKVGAKSSSGQAVHAT